MNMKNERKILIINILVICLYFLWPYFLNTLMGLFNMSNSVYLYISLSINFIFLFVIIYIYRNKISKYFSNYKTNLKSNFISSLKIFCIGLGLYILFCSLYKELGVPILNNQSVTSEMFKKIPVIFILNTLFYYPIIEELIFKMSFKDIFKNKWSFIIFTGLFNALFQVVFSFNNITDLLYLLPLTALISSFSYIYHKTDNIIYPILLRMCYNLIPCIIYFIDLFG